MKRVVCLSILGVLVSLPVLACKQPPFQVGFPLPASDLGDPSAGKPIAVQFMARTTGYSGRSDQATGQVTIAASSDNAGALSVSQPVLSPLPIDWDSPNLAFILTVNLTPNLSGEYSANITFTPTCVPFVGVGLGYTMRFSYGHGLVSVGNTPNSGGGVDPISTATGELFGHDDAADLFLGGPLPLEFRRYHASYLTSGGLTSALGSNWMHNFDVRLAVSGSSATVTLFRGKTVKFTQSGTTWTLSSNEQRPYQLAAVTGGGYRFLDPVSSLIYTFDSSGALIKIEDRSGNALTVTRAPGGVGPATVSDALGRTLTFTYSGANMVKVQDQSGRSLAFENSGGNLTAFTDANGKRSTYAYTTAGALNGLLSSETRPLGNKPFSQTFDAQGRVATQTDSFGNAAQIAIGTSSTTVTESLNSNFSDTHDTQMNLVKRTDAGGQSLQFAYDSAGRRTGSTDRLGNRSSITWTGASGLPATLTDVLGNSTSLAFSPASQNGFSFFDLTGVQLPDSSSLAFSNDTSGNLSAYTDQAGAKWSYTRNARGQILTRTNPSGGITTYTYGSDGNPASIKDDAGNITQIAYDSAGRPNLLTLPDGSTRRYQYDALGNLLRTTNELGKSTSSTYDDNNNLHTVTDALGGVTALGYDTNDHRVSVTDASGKTTRTVYDALSRVQSVTNAAGNSTTYGYDTRNRVTSAADAAGKGFTYAWDNENRLTAITDALSRTARVTRDAPGQITAITTPNNETYQFTYDKLGRTISTTNPLGQSTQYAYDPRGPLQSTRLPEGVSATFDRNELARITKVTDPGGNAWLRSYDHMGRAVSTTDPLGQTTAYQYNSRQRVDTITFPAGSEQILYDAASNITGKRYSDGTSLDYTYDANNRLVSGAGVAFAYDAAGYMTGSNGLQIDHDDAHRIAAVTYATGKVVRYSYSNRGLLIAVTDWIGGSFAFTYDDAGQLIAVVFPNGVREDYTYDLDGRLSAIRGNRGGTALWAIVLHRDADGKITSVDRPAALAAAPPEGHVSFAFDAAHQLAGAAYDAVGRIGADPLRTYQWDLASRLQQYTEISAISFTYDAMGQRTSRASAGATENYGLNYALPLPSVSVVRSGTADQRYYVWAPNGALLESIDAATGARRFYHFDESGSTAYLTDDSGSITDTYSVSPYGETVAHTDATANPFTYQGRFGVMQEGVSGLYYMRARYYDASAARFLSRDPEPGLDPRRVNPYQYALGNPLRFNDPGGRAETAPESTRYTVGLDRYSQGHFDLTVPLNVDPLYETPLGSPVPQVDEVIPISGVPDDPGPVSGMSALEVGRAADGILAFLQLTSEDHYVESGRKVITSSVFAQVMLALMLSLVDSSDRNRIINALVEKAKAQNIDVRTAGASPAALLVFAGLGAGWFAWMRRRRRGAWGAVACLAVFTALAPPPMRCQSSNIPSPGAGAPPVTGGPAAVRPSTDAPAGPVEGPLDFFSMIFETDRPGAGPATGLPDPDPPAVPRTPAKQPAAPQSAPYTLVKKSGETVDGPGPSPWGPFGEIDPAALEKVSKDGASPPALMVLALLSAGWGACALRRRKRTV